MNAGELFEPVGGMTGEEGHTARCEWHHDDHKNNLYIMYRKEILTYFMSVSR